MFLNERYFHEYVGPNLIEVVEEEAMKIDIVVGGLSEEKLGKRVTGMENKSKVQREWEAFCREFSARKLRK